MDHPTSKVVHHRKSTPLRHFVLSVHQITVLVVICLACRLSSQTATPYVHALSVPAPDGFAEAANLSETVKKMAQIGIQPPQKVLGVYVPLDVLVTILKTGYWDPSPMCKATRQREFATEMEAKAHLNLLRKTTAKEAAGGESEEAWQKRYFERLREESARILKDGANSVQGISFLGSAGEDDTHFSMLVIVNLQFETSRGVIKQPFAAAIAYTLVEKTIISLLVGRPFDGSSSVDTVNKTFQNWHKSIQAANGVVK